ncbi:MAG TPA: hypothetical protein K8V91_00395 [[Clostridium] spiroforme]|uniref:Uncharacterized protein n=1 Tax=Thomasclavelia spiroformis TaxID=29348 RepID=A0A921KIA0_9FIRM|nr:hypothetical protein [Thomasclavelia spiroformis]
MGDSKIIRYATKIQLVPSSMRKLNKQFSLVDILLCYHGDNRNRSTISKESIESALPSLYGIPIVGEYIYLDDGSQDFGSHGGKIIISDKGIKFEDTTKPYGFITKDAVENAQWVEITEKDGHTVHEYLELKGCIIWSQRYEEVSRILEENYGQSMEIETLRGYWNDNDYYEIEEFVFSAACILGSNLDGTGVEPCFESASIGRHYSFNTDSFKQEFSNMLDEYKKSQVTMKKLNKEGVQQMELKKFVEALSQVKINDTENAKYRLLSVSDEKVFVLDLEDYKAYGFNYAVTSDEDSNELVIDFDSKCEMSLSACDKITEEGFEEFSISDAINSQAQKETDIAMQKFTETLQAEYDARIEEIREKFNELDRNYNEALNELSAFKNAEAERKEQEHKDDVDAIINEFSKKIGRVPEFLIYKARLDYSKPVDEIRKDLTLMAGKSIMDTHSKANFSYTPVSTTLFKQKQSNQKSDRYGNLLDKFMK